MEMRTNTNMQIYSPLTLVEDLQDELEKRLGMEDFTVYVHLCWHNPIEKYMMKRI